METLWQRCSKAGDYAERKVGDWLDSFGYKVAKLNEDIAANRGKYDISAEATDGLKLTFEVKHDQRVHETGNYVVETHEGCMETGLSITEADYWVFFSEAMAYPPFCVVSPSAIEHYIWRERLMPRQISGATNAVGHLIHSTDMWPLGGYWGVSDSPDYFFQLARLEASNNGRRL